VKFLDSDGAGTTQNAIRAIDYAVANGAHIISNSWGGGGRSDFLEQAIARAVAQGILVTAAAGNEANDNDSFASYPANYDGVISVGSTTDRDVLSDFSNYGARTVMIAAPGSNIYSTYVGGGYKSLSGTSMATPQVSGALALALSLGRGLSADELKERLCDSSKKILLDRVRCGRMDVLTLLQGL
jgi:subtilisin family serine protease